MSLIKHFKYNIKNPILKASKAHDCRAHIFLSGKLCISSHVLNTEGLCFVYFLPNLKTDSLCHPGWALTFISLVLASQVHGKDCGSLALDCWSSVLCRQDFITFLRLPDNLRFSCISLLRART